MLAVGPHEGAVRLEHQLRKRQRALPQRGAQRGAALAHGDKAGKADIVPWFSLEWGEG